MVKIMKTTSLFLLPVIVLLGCSKTNDMNLKCDGKLSMRNESFPQFNKDYVQNIEMLLKIKDSQIYQMNHDGFVLLTVGEEGMSCRFDDENIICSKNKKIDSGIGSQKQIKIQKINGDIEIIDEGVTVNSKPKKVISSTIYKGNCQKMINKI